MEDIERAKLAGGAGAEKLEASKPFDVVDDQGNVVRNVMARERRDKPGFNNSETGQEIKLEPGQHLKQITPSQTGGGRAQHDVGGAAAAGFVRQRDEGRGVLGAMQFQHHELDQERGALGR